MMNAINEVEQSTQTSEGLLFGLIVEAEEPRPIEFNYLMESKFNKDV